MGVSAWLRQGPGEYRSVLEMIMSLWGRAGREALPTSGLAGCPGRVQGEAQPEPSVDLEVWQVQGTGATSASQPSTGQLDGSDYDSEAASATLLLTDTVTDRRWPLPGMSLPCRTGPMTDGPEELSG